MEDYFSQDELSMLRRSLIKKGLTSKQAYARIEELIAEVKSTKNQLIGKAIVPTMKRR